jgi:hypothetical protein
MDLNMETQEMLQIGNKRFTQIFESQFANSFVDENGEILLCILKAEYVPIAEFKMLFENMLDSVRNGKISTFIFDKRSLRTFHQPSMEWYYLEWKTEALKYGLKHHRKILPDLKWFVKAVEIAKKGLDARLASDVRDELDIRYVDSLDQAVS